MVVKVDFEKEVRILCNFIKKIELGAFVTATVQSREVQMDVAQKAKESLPSGAVQILDCSALDDDFSYTTLNFLDLLELDDATKAVCLIEFSKVSQNLSDDDFFFNLNMGRDRLAKLPVVFVFFGSWDFFFRLRSHAPDFDTFFRMGFRFQDEVYPNSFEQLK